MVVQCDSDHRQVGVDQRERAVLEFPGSAGLGVDVGVDSGDLLELQGALHRDRVQGSAPQEQRVMLLREAHREPVDHRIEA
jgi:hypothetical protein